jgi:AcrR family transcriptional regulator
MNDTESDTKSRILDIAWKLVTRRGRADVTMQQFAQAVGISRQALYLHFPNRASLLLAMVRRFDEVHLDPAEIAHRRALPPVEGFEAALRWWLGYLPRVFPVARALEAASIDGADGADAWADRMETLRATFGHYVSRLAEQGQLSAHWSVPQAADWVWARVNPSVWRHLVQERNWKPAQLVERLIPSIIAEIIEPARARKPASGRKRPSRPGL